jgi:pyruvate/2-oxoglutarate dehydrogenase complex dihydrolipoamide acyltransferase (E2) component
VFGVIYPPQVALVGFERLWNARGSSRQVVSRPVVTASLSADHRVTDGHRGGSSFQPSIVCCRNRSSYEHALHAG